MIEIRGEEPRTCWMTAPSTGYEYDIFFSYKRHDLTLEWTRRVHALLRFWITQELGGTEVRMFIDAERIETGDRWPEVLKGALSRSKCMVGIWSPEYFRSSWCVSEWESFREREKRLNLQSHGLIAPLRFHDGEHFPADAQVVQYTDVTKFNSTMPAFWGSRRTLRLEDALKIFARHVARMIQHAPAFEPDWPVVEVPGIAAPTIGLARL